MWYTGWLFVVKYWFSGDDMAVSLSQEVMNLPK